MFAENDEPMPVGILVVPPQVSYHFLAEIMFKCCDEEFVLAL
jgi:CRISPR/Cas system CMR subunit Cmr6 (Cas7 group RAMP superfamily)